MGLQTRAFSSDVSQPHAQFACVPEQIAEQAARNPDALAVTGAGQRLTYGELNRRANRLVGHLRSLGAGADSLVGLYLPRSVEMIVGALAVLRVGGAYVPMDPAYPDDRLTFMLDDAQASVLLSTTALGHRLGRAKAELVCIDTPGWDGESMSSAPVKIKPRDLAYVMYTSGSTGRPKGVEVTHANLANLVHWHNHAFSVSPADRASHVAGVGFDAAVWELWPYLAAGASVHLADEDVRSSADLLREWLLAQRITIGFVPTALAERMIASGEEWPPDTALRLMLTGGDTLQHYPSADLPFPLVNNYGPTECTVVAASGLVPPNASPDVLPPLGTSIANTQIYLLDEQLTPVPSGSAGEIYIGGEGLARGYRNLPELTSEKFVRNPFSSERTSRLYKTGDLARQLPDGRLVFLGWTDDQLKIRGYRIEPGEISLALNRHPDVRQSLVVAREDTPGDKRLVAYLVLDADSGLTHSALREFLRRFLPEYMLPAVFVRLDVWPFTSNGKIDRTALPAATWENTLQDDAPVRPYTDTEQRIAEILGELLGLELIDLDDNFFLLGGHSLLGAQLMARLRAAFGVEIGLRSLFEAPTVTALSAEVDRLSAKKQLPETTSERYRRLDPEHIR